MTSARKIKTTVFVFELPQKLGILQQVGYEPPPREGCTVDGCLREGLLVAKGCKRRVCIKYGCFRRTTGNRRRGSAGGGRGRIWVVALGNRWLTRCGSWLAATRWGCGMSAGGVTGVLTVAAMR
jgi:hypothetical protein